MKNFFFSTNATLLYFNQCHTYVGWNWVKRAFSQLSLKTLTSDAISGDDHAYLVWQFINQPKLPLYQQQKIQLVLTLLEKALHFGFLLHRDIICHFIRVKKKIEQTGSGNCMSTYFWARIFHLITCYYIMNTACNSNYYNSCIYSVLPFRSKNFSMACFVCFLNLIGLCKLTSEEF